MQTGPHAPLGGRTCEFLPFYSDPLQFADNGRTWTKKNSRKSWFRFTLKIMGKFILLK